MKYYVSINNKKYEVVVEKADEKEAVEEISYQKTVESPANVSEKSSDTASAAETTGNEEPVLCPMPGKILNVKIKEGQSVELGEVLFVLEAMKMENEILAERDCVVSKIMVSNGSSVKTGDVLALLK